jgi:hypothetical protein
MWTKKRFLEYLDRVKSIRRVNEQLAINVGAGSQKCSQMNIYTGDVYMNTMVLNEH